MRGFSRTFFRYAAFQPCLFSEKGKGLFDMRSLSHKDF